MIGLVSPEDIRPYLKGQARKESNRGRPKGRCVIATDTPEKMLNEEKKKKKIQMKWRLFEAKSSSSSEEEDNSGIHSKHSEIDWAGKSSGEEEPDEGNIDLASLNVGDWVAVEYNEDLFPRQIKSTLLISRFYSFSA
ncbi:hypothetical protein ILUMI_22171 [Ignelater luminosus]|uniref:Uncharacterized protein n=1 Tax=Ignelater luminosus TaxID=2038154 RepID=A0A8K0CEW7_IGNLU|nr:hypothetical protein ILUMI_22171 [Ignelater luminosus]